jgi:hypothetical protein
VNENSEKKAALSSTQEKAVRPFSLTVVMTTASGEK